MTFFGWFIYSHSIFTEEKTISYQVTFTCIIIQVNNESNLGTMF